METYEAGGHMYYTTMPTEALRVFRDVTRETALLGFDTVGGRASVSVRGFAKGTPGSVCLIL